MYHSSSLQNHTGLLIQEKCQQASTHIHNGGKQKRFTTQSKLFFFCNLSVEGDQSWQTPRGQASQQKRYFSLSSSRNCYQDTNAYPVSIKEQTTTKPTKTLSALKIFYNIVIRQMRVNTAVGCWFEPPLCPSQSLCLWECMYDNFASVRLPKGSCGYNEAHHHQCVCVWGRVCVCVRKI